MSRLRPLARAGFSFLALACLAGLAGAPRPASGQSDLVSVSNADALIAAIGAAEPGQTIQLEPVGPEPWDLPNRVVIAGAGKATAPITLRAEELGKPTLRFLPAGGIVEGFLVRAPYWTLENLDLVGACDPTAHSSCEHAVHIVGAADHTTIRGLRMEGFNAQIKGNGEDGQGGRAWPDDVLIEGSELYNATPRNTDNPVTPIDVVGGRRWVIRANHIHDFAKAGGNGISYAAFLKGNSRDGLFERNLVVCEQLHRGQIRLGISFGGGGSSPDPICEDGICTPEHQGGIMRNNIIAHCPADVGIYLNEATDTRVYHNLLYDTGGGIDVRFAASSAELRGNVLSGRIRERDGGSATRFDNLENVSAEDFDAWFMAPQLLDFGLRDGSALVDRGQPLAELPDDFCANARDDGAPDLGAVEFDGDLACDTTRAHAIGPAPQPSETPSDPTETPPAPSETPSDPTETPPAPTETPGDPTETPSETPPTPTETPSAATETPPTPTETPSAPTETPPGPTATLPGPIETPGEPSPTPPSPTPLPISDVFVVGTVYDGGREGDVGLGGAWIAITDCEGETLRFPNDFDGSYRYHVPDEWLAGCEAWDYRVTSPGFRPHLERVSRSEALGTAKDFRLYRLPLYLPLLVDRARIRR